MTNPAAEPLDPERYLRDVLDYIQRHSVKRLQFDWEAWRTEVLATAAGAASVAETYPAIRHGLQLLGDGHSHFRDPEQTAQSGRALAQQGYLAARRPAGRLVAAGIALLELPGCVCRGQATCGPYAEAA